MKRTCRLGIHADDPAVSIILIGIGFLFNGPGAPKEIILVFWIHIALSKIGLSHTQVSHGIQAIGIECDLVGRGSVSGFIIIDFSAIAIVDGVFTLLNCIPGGCVAPFRAILVAVVFVTDSVGKILPPVSCNQPLSVQEHRIRSGKIPEVIIIACDDQTATVTEK